ncbi:MAG: hypothetical protein R3309_15120, partial [Reinekea sp.]|nr:hypothetical protein [Reinekea sp.]
AAAESDFKQLMDAKADDPIPGHRFYDKVNKLIQSETQCEYLHLHHCRHTLASQLLLSVCEESVDYWRMSDDFPWLKDALISNERLDIFLGGEGSGVGHGVQAISALMGHAHPTTTLRHYIHTCGIAFYALQQKLNRLDLSQSFKSRLPVATVEQWVRQSRKKTGDMPAKMSVHAFNRNMRDLIERRFKQAIHFDEARLEKVELVEDITTEPEDGLPAISIERFDSLDMALRNTLFDELEADHKKIASALVDIGEIKSGKRGSTLPRHKLDYSGENPVPVDTKAGSPIVVAQILCEWLTELLVNRVEDYRWLLIKWLYQTEAQRGWITLDNQEEIDRIKSLPETKELAFEIKPAAVSKARSKGVAKATMRARFRFKDEKGKPIQKNVMAVKWVMLWCSAQG